MPTNDERREVAAKLRELVADWFDDGEFYDRVEVEDVLGLATDDGAWYEAAGVRRLADLIEPEERTCHIYDTDHGFEDSIRCDACQMTFRRPWQPFKFCPNCGAKVVDQ